MLLLLVFLLGEAFYFVVIDKSRVQGLPDAAQLSKWPEVRSLELIEIVVE